MANGNGNHFWSSVFIGTGILLAFLVGLWLFLRGRYVAIASPSGTNATGNSVVVGTNLALILRHYAPYILTLILLVAVVLLVYWVLVLRKENVNQPYKIFEDKDIITMARAQDLISKKFSEFGCPATTEEKGWWIFKTKTWKVNGLEFMTQRYFSFRNQPVGLFEVGVHLGQFAGQILSIFVPLAKGEKAIAGWNVQLVDENRFGFKLEKNNFPLLAPMSQAERVLEELYRVSEGDPEKIAEIKDVLALSKEMPESLASPSEAAPPEFAKNWQTQNKKPYTPRPPYGYYGYPPSEEE